MSTYEPESEWLLNNHSMDLSPLTGCGCVYVDLGCAHPINKSLTCWFREHHWTGISIDGNPDYANDWAAASYGRHFVCAVLSDQPTARFVIHDNAFTSRISDSPETDYPNQWGINRVEERSTIALNHLLDVHEIGKIDLLTVDLEGHEFAVLQTLDWQKHQPAWVIAEYVTTGAGVDSRLCNFLLGLGYEVVHMTNSNLIFKRK